MSSLSEPSIFVKTTGVDLVESAFRLGVITVNEMRQALDLEPVPGADVTIEKLPLDEHWNVAR